MNQGVLVPDELTIDIVLERVLSLNSDDGFVLDGFPRNPKQAQVLEDALSKRARGLDKVLHIDVPEAELVRRLSGRFNCRECQATYSADHLETERLPTCRNCGGELYQREDDSPAAVDRRIQVYRSETTPVLEFYRDRGILVDIPGTGSVDSVKDRVLAALGRS
jgi:adenylate kinase